MIQPDGIAVRSRGGPAAPICVPRGRNRLAGRVFLAVVAALLAGTYSARAQTPTVVQIELSNIVHPVSAEFLAEGLAYAAEIDAAMAVVRLDTPGGLVDSMRDMVEAILASPVPVAIWVGPSGVRAASAGFFILLSGDLALMASGTNTGAAHPVSSFGADIGEVMEEKIVNDVSAFLRSYVARRGRNPEEAELAVTESKSFTAEEALDAGFIDAVVASVPDMIEAFDGQQDTPLRRFGRNAPNSTAPRSKFSK